MDTFSPTNVFVNFTKTFFELRQTSNVFSFILYFSDRI